MKYIIWLFFIASFTSIVSGLATNLPYSQKLIGFGTLGLFFIVIPLFIYSSWKDKNFKDYMLNNENLEKMRNNQKKNNF